MAKVIISTNKRTHETTIKTEGFEGEACLKFDGAFASVGQVKKTDLTDEFYQARQEEVEQGAGNGS